MAYHALFTNAVATGAMFTSHYSCTRAHITAPQKRAPPTASCAVRRPRSLSVSTQPYERARYGLRAGVIASAGVGFGLSSNSGEDVEQVGYPSDDEGDYEEVDFGYAASVVSETWELFEEADAEQREAFGEFFWTLMEEFDPEVQQLVAKQNAQDIVKSGFVPFVSEVVDAIADTSTLPVKITAKKEQFDSYGFEATKHFPLVAQSMLLTLDQFFLEGEFTEAVEDAWVGVMGVIDQVLIDPTQDYFVDDDESDN